MCIEKTLITRLGYLCRTCSVPLQYFPQKKTQNKNTAFVIRCGTFIYKFWNRLCAEVTKFCDWQIMVMHFQFISVLLIMNGYFWSVSITSFLHRLLSLLDQSTLRLLADNISISEFSPVLHSELEVLCDSLGPSAAFSAISSPIQVVPFMADKDNRRNFPTDKSFHSFKKQRWVKKTTSKRNCFVANPFSNHISVVSKQ